MINGQTFQGTTGPSNVAVTSGTFTWSSDGSVRRGGWRICLGSGGGSPTAAPTTAPTSHPTAAPTAAPTPNSCQFSVGSGHCHTTTGGSCVRSPSFGTGTYP